MEQFLNVNWEKEGLNVKEAIFSVVKAHDLYELMTETEKARFDELFELMSSKAREDKPKEVTEKKEFADEFTQASQSMSWMFPLMFLVFGTQWPSALALYWSVSTVIAIIQQYQITGLGGLKKYLGVLHLKGK